MVFSSLTFLYWFLPITVGAYFVLPGKLRNGWLLFTSLVFYGWAEPKLLILLLAEIGFFFLCGIRMEKSGNKKLWLWLACLVGVGALGVFKYADFFLGSIRAVTGLPLPLLGLALPMGISFYTFQSLSYAADVYRGKVRAQRNFVNFAAYVALFPQLVAGPIVRYADIARELESRRTSWEDFYAGLSRFIVGLGKKVLLADSLARLADAAEQSAQPTAVLTLLGALAFTLEIYFDFSGYSDMAIGLGRVFGFHFCENFNYPYCSRSVTEFWRRWHMSLSYWFRDYVYIPLGGSRVSRGKWIRNIFVVWMLTGLWHGAGWNFVAWGFLYALLLLLEKAVPGLKKLPGAWANVYVMAMVTIGFVVFQSESLSAASVILGRICGMGVPIFSVETGYLLRSYGVLLFASAVGATALPKAWAEKVSSPIVKAVFLLAVFALSTATLVSGSFSPFLYFRF